MTQLPISNRKLMTTRPSAILLLYTAKSVVLTESHALLRSNITYYLRDTKQVSLVASHVRVAHFVVDYYKGKVPLKAKTPCRGLEA
jgi:hypothetical protein